MVPNGRQCPGVQALDQKRGQAADHHGGEVRVHSPSHRVGAQEARIALRLGKRLERSAGTGQLLNAPGDEGAKWIGQRQQIQYGLN